MIVLYVRDINDKKNIPGCTTRMIDKNIPFPMPCIKWSLSRDIYSFQKGWIPRWILYDEEKKSVIFFESFIKFFMFIHQPCVSNNFESWTRRHILYWDKGSHNKFPSETRKLVINIYMTLRKLGIPAEITIYCITFANFASLIESISVSDLKVQKAQNYEYKIVRN